MRATDGDGGSWRRRGAWRLLVLVLMAVAPVAGGWTAAAQVPDAGGAGWDGLGTDVAAGPDGPGTDTPGGGTVVRPVGGGVVGGFDPPADPYGAGHRGVDLAAGPGDEVRSALAGTVSFAGPVAGLGWVTVGHGGGLETTYGVLVELRVSAGDRVAAGDVLGVLGADADHVDWGARQDGRYVDPLALLGRWEVHLIEPGRLVAPAAPPTGAVPGACGGVWTWPAAGRISSGFGYRTHPISGERRLHAGTDVAAPEGTPIVAARDGTVASAGWSGGYGNLVVLDHGDGHTSRYAHTSRMLVGAGDPVQRGQLIARVGSTGDSTGPHLHFEIRWGGVPTDPLAYVGEGPCPAGTGDGGGEAAVARAVYAVGVELGVSDRVLLAAFETGLVESGLRNLPDGHADSAGVFQQRPSQGWGTLAQVTDVRHAARSFYLGAGTNRGAVSYDRAGFAGSAGQLAARVQRPRRDLEWKYDAREADALAVIARERAATATATAGAG